jgi:hypothetical protein
MPNRWIPFGNDATIWRVGLALLLSLLFHFILLGLVNIDLSIFTPKKQVIEVRFANLVKRSAPKSVLQKDDVQEVEAPELEAPQAQPEIEPPEPVQPESEAQAAVTGLAEVHSPAAETATEMPAREPASLGDAAEEMAGGDAGADVEKTASEPAPEANEGVIDELTPPLTLVDMEFDILRGANGNKIGKTTIHFQSNDDGTYVIESISEAKGLVSLFIPGKLVQRSEGLVTASGLLPSTFLYQFGGDSKAQRARFDWNSGEITLETSKGIQTRPLPKGSQDLVSFMYQFMFVPPLQEMQLNITNGKRLKTYAYSFIGEVDLSTKMGTVHAMHIENSNDDGDEKNELWLAVDYHFLPVKIRKTEKDGSVIEQVITNIKTDSIQ